MKSTAISAHTALDWLALWEAWRQYSRGKCRRPDVAAFECEVDRQLLYLAEAMQLGRYRHGDYRLIEIRDPKPRLIAVASVRDRVAHTAIYRALGAFFNRMLIDDCYACLPGRGSHRAVLRFKQFQSNYRFLMHLDIRAYYPSIRHDRLTALLKPHLLDPAWSALFVEILASGDRFYRRERVITFYGLGVGPDEVSRGLPIGNLTSQWWGNWYLNGLDHFAKRVLKARGHLRYMDDMVFFANDRATLRRWREQVTAWLKTERDLQLNVTKSHIRCCQAAHTYLGYQSLRGGSTWGQKPNAASSAS